MFSNSFKVITIGFGTMLFFLILVATVALTSTHSLNEQINELVHNRNVKTNLISDMRNIARERSLSLYRMVLLQDPFEVDEEQMRMSSLAGQFLENREQLLQLKMSEDEELMLSLTLEQAYISTRFQRELVEIIKQESFDDAKEFLMQKAIPEQNLLLSKYDELIDLQKKKSELEAQSANKKHIQTRVFLFVFSLSIIAVGLGISIFVIRKTTRAEKALRAANENLESRVLERTHSLFEANQELQATIETLKDTQEQLVQAEKMASLGSLVAGISHEINTPIGIGVTAVTHLQEQHNDFIEHYKNDTMTREHLDDYLSQSDEVCKIVIKNINRAADLIKTFKQIAVDQSTNEFSNIDLHHYVDDILMSLHPKIKQTNVTVNNQCDTDLSIYTNPGAIYQVLSNLVLNSLIHAYDEGDTGNINVIAHVQEAMLELTYSDDGKGISEENLKKIFDPFFTTKRGAGGSGLGLHIIYNLVTNTLKGTIRAASKEGEGTSFFISLPMFEPPKTD